MINFVELGGTNIINTNSISSAVIVSVYDDDGDYFVVKCVNKEPYIAKLVEESEGKSVLKFQKDILDSEPFENKKDAEKWVLKNFIDFINIGEDKYLNRDLVESVSIVKTKADTFRGVFLFNGTDTIHIKDSIEERVEKEIQVVSDAIFTEERASVADLYQWLRKFFIRDEIRILN